MSARPVSDHDWLLAAVDLSRRCPPVTTAYSVGAIVVGGDGNELARGYSRDTDPEIHAEESVLARLAGADLAGSTLYTSLEPCGARRSRPRTCTALILATGISRVVFALREPPVLAAGGGAERLGRAGREVVQLRELAPDVRVINAHILAAGRSH
jgi:pyrimidine deaminase RibD-like protein